VLTHFRLIALAVIAAIAAGASAAAAFWPAEGNVVRLSPAYGGICEACDLSGRILVDARMQGGAFRNAKFSSAVMTRASAADADFEGSDFTDAILDEADFTRARFGRARMERATLIGADFSGADLSRASGLTPEQLARACGDADTRLPRGLAIPNCASVGDDSSGHDETTPDLS